jgi:hypothetical protein
MEGWRAEWRKGVRVGEKEERMDGGCTVGGGLEVTTGR